MDLKETDYKLLNYLYHNYDEPLSKIAKAVKLSRDQVEYRINKYLKEGLIRKFFPLFDWGALGYDLLVILLLKFESQKTSEGFMKNLDKSKNCITYGKIYGKFDIFLECVFKNENEMNQFIAELFEDRTNYIKDYIAINPQFAELYPLKFSNDFDKESYVLSNKNKEIKLDKTDLKILKILSEDGRAKLIDIAIKSGISSELALYRLKKLKKERILLGNRIQFNMSVLGYFYTMIWINFRHFSEANKEKLKSFAKSSKNVNSLIFNLQRPHCIIKLFHKDEREVRAVVDQVKELFYDDSIELEIIPVGEDEQVIRPLPFL